MNRAAAALVLLSGCAAPGPTPAPPLPASNPKADAVNEPLKAAVEPEVASLVDLYKWFHQNAELSLKEEKTAAKFADAVRRAGWQVHEKIGGTGVVAVLQNGEGPTVLARIDMDGLPVKEETGLPYASQGPAMHACGHDTHLTIGVGAARALAKVKDRWSGTIVLVGQPAEELGVGATNMLKDPKFHEIVATKPVACLSVHDFTEPAGTVAICPGFASANVDSIDITVFGEGGHGAWPHQTIDPIVIASEIVTALQTIVSRKLAPGTKAVITVGSFHAGTKHNIIPDEAKLQLTVRSYEDDVRQTLLAEIRRIAEHVAAAHRVKRAPEVKSAEEYTPAGYHDPELSARIRGVFERLLGAERVLTAPPVMGGEDFSRFPRHYGVPGLQFRVGGAPKGHPANIGLHSSKWAAEPEPTVRTGSLAFARALLDLVNAR